MAVISVTRNTTAFGANCVKFTKAGPILSATKMYPRESSFWQCVLYMGRRALSLWWLTLFNWFQFYTCHVRCGYGWNEIIVSIA